MQVSWTPAALWDIEQIIDHIAKDNPVAAYKLAATISRHTDELLADNPMIGRRGRRDGTRELIITGTRYVVAYRVRDRVEVLAVVHGAREWPEGFV